MLVVYVLHDGDDDDDGDDDNEYTNFSFTSLLRALSIHILRIMSF